MTQLNVRRLIMLLGAALLVAGVIGLLVPVSVGDGSGGSIECGNAASADLSGARAANDTNGANIPIIGQFIPHTDYVAQCQSALSGQRSWSIPVTVIGIVVISGALVPELLTRRSRRTTTGRGPSGLNGESHAVRAD